MMTAIEPNNCIQKFIVSTKYCKDEPNTMAYGQHKIIMHCSKSIKTLVLMRDSNLYVSNSAKLLGLKGRESPSDVVGPPI